MPRATLSAVSISRYASTSRARSSSHCFLRKNRLKLTAFLLFHRTQHPVHGLYQPVPTRGLLRQLFTPHRRKPVIARLAIALRSSPERSDPPPVFQPVQRGIERTVLYLKNVF